MANKPAKKSLRKMESEVIDEFDYDLIVIGAGSGGVRCARVASGLGARVAIIENRYLGGTCVNVGCVPKKLFVYAARFRDLIDEALGFGWNFQNDGFDWHRLRDNKTAEIQRLNRVYEGILEAAGVEIIRGHGSLTSAHGVTVSGRHLTAKNILLATGGWPKMGSYPGAEHTITSNEVFALERFPNSILIEGGGYIAVEFAGIFNGLGCVTQLCYRGPLFLREFDVDVREFLAAEIRKKGVDVSFNRQIAAIEKLSNGQLRVVFNDGNETLVDCVLSAIGRQPMVDGLGLENTSVQLNQQGFIRVDEQFKTAENSIYALGDVIGRVALTPVALNEGMKLAHHLFAGEPLVMSYDNIPTAVFSQPELATVGLNEEAARCKYSDIEVYRSSFRPLKNTLSGSAEKMFMKLIVAKQSKLVIGCHMVGDGAAEIMQGIAIAVKMGATKTQFDETLGIHPTAAEEWVTLR